MESPHSKECRLFGGIFAFPEYPADLFAALGVLALLISDAAAGLASGLAGSLAFSASALLGAFAQIPGGHGFDMAHWERPPFAESVKIHKYCSISAQDCQPRDAAAG